MLVGADDGTVDEHHRFRRLSGQGIEYIDPNPCLGPPVEPVVDRGVRAVALGKIASGRSRAQDVENAVQNTPVIHTRHPSGLVRQERLYDPPLCVAQIKPRHDPSLFLRIESQQVDGGNPVYEDRT